MSQDKYKPNEFIWKIVFSKSVINLGLFLNVIIYNSLQNV